MNSNKTLDLFTKYIIPTYARFPVSFEYGEGAYLYSDSQEKYLDFVSGIAVNSLGHQHPKIIKTITEQAGKLIHISNLYLNRPQAELAKFLVENVMHTAGKCFFCNSGAEANEALIKLSRRLATAKNILDPEIITFNNSFHGRTMAGISATGQEKVKIGFAPLLSGFKHLQFNNPEDLINNISSKTVAIMLEIIQGEGGVSVATANFLETIQRVSKEKEILILVDEVQAGLGRTGKINSWEGILPSFKPDAVSWAKGLGGGFPIGAVWVKEKLFEKYLVSDLLNAGSHGTTYGGNPLAAAVALSVLEELVSKDLLDNVNQQAENLRSKIIKLNLPWIKNLKGLGLMIGLELNLDWIKSQLDFNQSETPSLYLVKKLFANKLLTVAAGESVVRLLPPLNISNLEVDLAIAKIQAIF